MRRQGEFAFALSDPILKDRLHAGLRDGESRSVMQRSRVRAGPQPKPSMPSSWQR